MLTSRFGVLCAAVLAVPFSTAFAAPDWGVADGDWMVDANWTGGLVPSGAQEAALNNSGTVQVNSTTTYHRDFWVNTGTLNINNGGTLNNDRGFKLSNGATANLYAGGIAGGGETTIGRTNGGFFNQYGGTFNSSFTVGSGTYHLYDGVVSAFTTFWSGGSGAGGSMIQDAGSFTISRTSIIGIGGTATYQLNGGTFASGEGFRFMHIGGGRADVSPDKIGPGTGHMIQTGGTATINSDLLVGVRGGTGTIQVSGGSFTAVNIALGDPTDTDPSAATNSGTFTVTGSAATQVRFTSNSATAWNQGPADTLVMQLDAGGVTPITITGGATFDPTSILNLDALPSFAGTEGQTFNLMQLTNGVFTGMPALAAEDAASWTVGVDGTGKILQATFIAVPEPTTMLLLAFGAPALLVRRRQK